MVERRDSGGVVRVIVRGGVEYRCEGCAYSVRILTRRSNGMESSDEAVQEWCDTMMLIVSKNLECCRDHVNDAQNLAYE